VLPVLAGIALSGLVAGWVLGVSFIAGGPTRLHARRWWWWALAAAGAGVALLALTSNLAPPSRDYSELWWFRLDFGMFSLGVPLLLPLLHLTIERWRGSHLLVQRRE